MIDLVVVLKDDKEIKEVYKRVISGNLIRLKIDVWFNRLSLELFQCILDIIVRYQVEINRKFGRVLEILESQLLQEISGFSDYLRYLIILLRIIFEVIVIIESRQFLSAIRLFDKENCGEFLRLNELFVERFDEEDVVEEFVFENFLRENLRQIVRVKDLQVQFIRIVFVDRFIDSCLYVAFYDFSVVNSMIVLYCFSIVTIIEVNFFEDIVFGKCEFVVNKVI